MSTSTDTSVLDRLAPWQARLRAEFPILHRDPGLAYLDSAATAQKPAAVLEAVTEYLTTTNANVGRGSYPWATGTAARVEAARERVRKALGDNGTDSSVEFVGGTSHGLRAVAQDWLADLLADGDEIIVPFGDHEANLRPWLDLRDELARRGVRVTVVPMPVDPASGDYDHRALPAVVTPRTRFVAVTHVHHVFGADMNVHRVREAVGPDVPICLDAAQSVGHGPVSVAELDVDFVVFSGHKMMALPGVGAVWARNRRGPRFALRGWEGTPNTAGIISVAAAFDWLEGAGLERVREWNAALCVRLTDGLSRLAGVRVLGCQHSLTADSAAQRRESIVTFQHARVRSDDLGFVLADEGIMVRADNHCQAGRAAGDAAVRVSVHVYNTPEEIDRLLAVVGRCEGMTS
ncbi:aminotransferase class V-fold PLP-dependent enzyme [Nocardia puris]|uniref:aminotransferase class V-fold PLP-dependent enzyme n=1 Tax=Nocardia puris TaxID=208602 RepID=UPI001894561A|nr:aminotransferase class V-fold PLP-dependent enzyme [Nocardia puris]MBF6212818.1 aminotransferase class V-fold PLP-dependent enzyme [Nocardia puris]MBF6367753.1 aminotransferase class V-fold PLP-dependent enzyme [Nocardia puris]MBF6461404.1 aminotransferase class V-fold PLP-dependent enzyme [Nocardia puris]